MYENLYGQNSNDNYSNAIMRLQFHEALQRVSI